MDYKRVVVPVAFVAVATILLSGAVFYACANSPDELRVSEKVKNINEVAERVRLLTEQSMVLQDEIGWLQYLNEHDITEEEITKNDLRIAKLQQELDATYSLFDVLQEYNYKLFVIPEEKITRISEAKDRAMSVPSIGGLMQMSYIDHMTEEIVFVHESGLDAKSRGDLDERIASVLDGERYRLTTVVNAIYDLCKAGSDTCHPTTAGLKVSAFTSHGLSGTQDFAADGDGDDGFVIGAHRASDVTGGTVTGHTKCWDRNRRRRILRLRVCKEQRRQTDRGQDLGELPCTLQDNRKGGRVGVQGGHAA